MLQLRRTAGAARSPNRKVVVALGGAILVAALAWSPAAGLQGGNEVSPYRFTDSDEPNGPDSPSEGSYIDTSNAGEFPLVGRGDDDVYGPRTLPFEFRFFDPGVDVRSAFYIASNGFLAFGAKPTHGCCRGGPIPSLNTPNSVLAAYWGDLFYQAPTSGIFAGLDAASGRYVVEYRDARHWDHPATVNLQVQLLPAAPGELNRIEVHYLAAHSDGRVHTAGLEDATGTVATLYLRGAFDVVDRTVRYTPSPTPFFGLPCPAEDLLVGVPVTLEPDNPALNPYYTAWGDSQDWGIGTTHTYAEYGTFDIRVRGYDAEGLGSVILGCTVRVITPPPGPPQLGVPNVGSTLLPVQASFNATDPDGDPVAFWIDWGTGEAPERWPAEGFVPHIEFQFTEHLYDAAGTYPVFACAEDPSGSIGARSEVGVVRVFGVPDDLAWVPTGLPPDPPAPDPDLLNIVLGDQAQAPLPEDHPCPGPVDAAWTIVPEPLATILEEVGR